jgi:hypothetical protein
VIDGAARDRRRLSFQTFLEDSKRSETELTIPTIMISTSPLGPGVTVNATLWITARVGSTVSLTPSPSLSSAEAETQAWPLARTVPRGLRRPPARPGPGRAAPRTAGERLPRLQSSSIDSRALHYRYLDDGYCTGYVTRDADGNRNA